MAVIPPVKGRESYMKSTTFICFLIALTMASAFARADDITAMISQYRREHGLPAVKTDPKLTAVAERQAQAMARSGVMDHDVDGSFASRVSGASLVTGAENIAAGTKTWSDTLRLWKESSGHNKNLLTPGADLLGVAVAHNENTKYKTYWAMVIGRRDVKRKPGLIAASAGGTVRAGAVVSPAGRGIDAAPDTPTGDSSVSEWVNHTIKSIKNLLP
jgi:Cysteine-rich secretory protein family